MKLVVVKLGGSVITHKDRPFSVNNVILEKYGEVLSTIREEGWHPILVLGGGSFGHYVAKVYSEHSNREPEKLSAITLAMLELAQLVADILQVYSLDPVILPPHAFCKPRGLKPNCDWSIVRQVLAVGATPLLFGDACLADRRVHIVSGDELSIEAACALRAEIVAYATSVEGVYAKGGVVRIVNGVESLRRLMGEASGSKSMDVTGGMRRKLEAIIVNACRGVNVVIYDGRRPENLLEILRSPVERRVGTTIIL